MARRTNLETDAECLPIQWTNLLTIDKSFLPSWRESAFPGGCAHACELETSVYMYLDPDNVREDRIANGTISYNEENNPFNWVDCFATGPATVLSWTASYSESGVLGEPELATVEKGQRAYEESVAPADRIHRILQGPPQGRPRGIDIARRRRCRCRGTRPLYRDELKDLR